MDQQPLKIIEDKVEDEFDKMTESEKDVGMN